MGGAPGARYGCRLHVAALVLGVAAPVLVVAVFVGVHGSNVPFWDQWEISADIAIRAADGSLVLGDLFRQHNEHRLVFSHAVTAGLVRVGGWSLRTEMWIGVATAAVTLCMLLFVLRRDDPLALAFVAVPFSALLFSLRADFNWVMSLQTSIQFFLVFTVASVAVVRLFPPGYAPLLAAAAFGLCATYAHGAGVLVWPVVLGVMPLLGYRRGRFVAFWLLIAVVALWRFLEGYRPGTLVELSARVADFGFRFLGNPLVRPLPGAGDEARAAAVAGLALFAANIVALRLRGRSWRQLATWIALAVLAMAMATTAAGYRTGLGLREALHPRYAAQASLFWLALVALSGQVLAEGRRQIRLGPKWRGLVILNAGLIVVVLGTQVDAAFRARDAGLVSAAQDACLRCYPTTRDPSCLVGLHPAFAPSSPDRELRTRFLERIDGLAAHRLAVFMDGEPRCAPVSARVGSRP